MAKNATNVNCILILLATHLPIAARIQLKKTHQCMMQQGQTWQHSVVSNQKYIT
jgi:hypothetical protein